MKEKKKGKGIFGIGYDTDESRTAGAYLFSVMSGEEITPEMIEDGSYLEKVKPISAADWITKDSAPTVVAYGTCDKVKLNHYLATNKFKKVHNNIDLLGLVWYNL